ncbi:hypothetical protein D2T31_21615 [Sinirhodobacter populi]|uniref:Uncharacterized protein n=1 Tax=Paenirhodobacter populi TaxID=2306993 RepID=A0A443JYX2_9RHOB|nr:hypothetical protein [Sinirhodobacter populi]RWR25707.1 hypothetical protein D2T31_21615 [Sinirhodobacter populi]
MAVAKLLGHAPSSLALKPGKLGNFQTALLGKIRPALTQVSPAMGGRWPRQIRSTGEAGVSPLKRPAGTGKLASHISFHEELMTQDPDFTFWTLRDALADAERAAVHHYAIAGLLRRLLHA